MGDGVRIRLLGGFEVELAGRVIEEHQWPRRRPMELVQLLALAPNRSLLRDQAIEALWPHLERDAGAANLRKAAHHARQVLGEPDAVVLRAGEVRLFPTCSVETDVEQFHAAAAAALETDRNACREIADLVSGELLPGAIYEDWNATARRRFETTLLSLLRCAEAWDRVLDIDPTDELAAQELMRAAIAAGARSDAVRRYLQISDALARELGVRPSAATLELYETAIAGLESPAKEVVGRNEEFSAAERAVLGPDRRAGAVVVRGTAGMGKSAFCRELAARLRRSGRAVWNADTAGEDRAFGPLISIIEEIALDPAEPLSEIPEHARSVLSSLTVVAPPSPPVQGPLTRHQVIGALTLALRSAAAGREIVVMLDDAHEADAGTLDTLVHMASSVPDVFVVLAMRPEGLGDDLARGLERLRRANRVVDIDVGGLAPADAARLARDIANGTIEERTIDEVVQRADGNPFVITELAALADPAGTDLPLSTAAAIVARLVGLDADAVQALQRLALHRDDLDGSSVIALTALDEDTAFSVLDRALDAGVLVVINGKYRFRHELVREALAGRVPPHRRLELHRQAAERLAAIGAPPAVVAWHWLAGEKPTEATQWALSAATEAMRVGAFRDARRHIAPVLRHDPGHPRALQLDAECLDMLGDPGTLAAYDKAIAVSDDSVGDDLVIARALAQIKQGDPAGGLAAVRGATPRSLMGRLNEALTYAGAAALGVTDPALGTEKAAQVRRIALEAGDRAGIVIAAWAHAAAAHARGDLHDSVLTDLRETSDLPHLAVRVFDGHLCMTQRFLYGSRPYDEVLSFADALTAEARRLGALRGEAFGITLRAEAEYLSGCLKDAQRDFAAGLALHRETGGTTGEAHALQRVAELLHTAGETTRARAAIEQALTLTRISDIGFHLLDRIYGSRITISADPDEALAAVEEAEAAVQGPLETCPGCRIHLTVPAALASAKAGDLERARRYADASEYLANVVMRLPAWYAALDEVHANLARAEGDISRAAELFGAAAQKYAGAGHPLDELRCLAERS